MNRSFPLVPRICAALARILSVLMVVALILMFVSVGVQIIARSLFSTSVLWLDDMLMSCFTISIFTGIALAFRNRAHLATTVIADSLPPAAARIYGRLIDLISLLAMIGLAWIGIEFTQGAFGQFTPVLRLPLGWVYLIIPITAAISVLFILENEIFKTDSDT